jgi:hypothetical protein
MSPLGVAEGSLDSPNAGAARSICLCFGGHLQTRLVLRVEANPAGGGCVSLHDNG